MWILNNMYLKQPMGQWRAQGKWEDTYRKIKMKHNIFKNSLNVTLTVFSQKIIAANTYIKSKKAIELLILTAGKLEQRSLHPIALPKQINKNNL